MGEILLTISPREQIYQMNIEVARCMEVSVGLTVHSVKQVKHPSDCIV